MGEFYLIPDVVENIGFKLLFNPFSFTSIVILTHIHRSRCSAISQNIRRHSAMGGDYFVAVRHGDVPTRRHSAMGRDYFVAVPNGDVPTRVKNSRKGRKTIYNISLNKVKNNIHGIVTKF